MEFKIFDLGLVDFYRALQFQKDIFSAVKNQDFNFALIFCRHHPVITLGRSACRDNIRVSAQELEIRGIGVYEIERGGDATYHGPGQITVYPIFNLHYLKKDIHLFLRQLEAVVIDLLSDFGVPGLRCPGRTGVWIGEKKIASIGIAIKSWITWHGLSINIQERDLDNFHCIRPCGMDIEMTSLERESGVKVSDGQLKEGLKCAFRNTFFPGAIDTVGNIEKEALVWSR